MPRFRTLWNLEEFEPVPEAQMSAEVITETTGYVPPEIRIKEMIQSGQALRAFREENYDFPFGEEVPDDYFDPTRAHGYDQDDAFEDLRAGVATLAAKGRAKKDIEAKKDEDKGTGVDGNNPALSAGVDGKDA